MSLIVIEGGDGVGKTEQSVRLLDRLRGAGRPAILTREPTSGPIGALIRSALRHEVELAPEAMAPLYAADRRHHAALLIGPALARGDVVVCDRYELSNLVYRAAEVPVWRCGMCGRESYDLYTGLACCKRAFHELLWPRSAALSYARALSRGIVRPDLTVVLTAPLDVCASRRAARGGAPELFDDTELQERVHALYADAARLLEGERVAMVDAAAEPDVVEARVWAAVEAVLPPRAPSAPGGLHPDLTPCDLPHWPGKKPVVRPALLGSGRDRGRAFGLGGGPAIVLHPRSRS